MAFQIQDICNNSNLLFFKQNDELRISIRFLKSVTTATRFHTWKNWWITSCFAAFKFVRWEKTKLPTLTLYYTKELSVTSLSDIWQLNLLLELWMPTHDFKRQSWKVQRNEEYYLSKNGTRGLKIYWFSNMQIKIF